MNIYERLFITLLIAVVFMSVYSSVKQIKRGRKTRDLLLSIIEMCRKKDAEQIQMVKNGEMHSGEFIDCIDSIYTTLPSYYEIRDSGRPLTVEEWLTKEQIEFLKVGKKSTK